MSQKTKNFPQKRLIVTGSILLGVITLLIMSFTLLLPDYMTPQFLHRTIVNGDASVTDWQNVFPRREVSHNPRAISALPAGKDVTANRQSLEAVTGKELQSFVESTDSTSLLVIKNDTVVAEAYATGHNAATLHTSMSVAKSFISALTGIAIAEGHIKSVNDPVVQYLPELKGRISDEMTIKHLLTMRGGNAYDDQGGINGDDTMAYWATDIRANIRQYFTSQETPGARMHYNDLQPQALGMILEKATGMTISHYMQEKLWKPAGMEFNASWSLDSKKSGFEQSAIGFNASSRDFARFGLLYLHNGLWNGRQIIPESWVKESTTSDNGYGYYWWIGSTQDSGAADYSARGNHGQLIYVSPSTNTVIVRTGGSTGGVHWPDKLSQMAQALK